jgi:hypothetical protein
MRKHKKPVARAKPTKRGKGAAMPVMPIIVAGMLGVGLASTIFFANDREIKRSSAVSARVAPKIEEITSPKPEIAAIPAPEIITGSIPKQEPAIFAAPLSLPKPKLAKKKTPPQETNSLFSFFTIPQQQKNISPKKP